MKSIIFIVLILGLVAGAGFYWMENQTLPEATVVDIPPGTSVREITEKLSEAGFEIPPLVMEVWIRAKRMKLKAGEYDLDAGMTPRQALQKIQKGDVKRYEITIPEGYNLQDIRRLLSEKMKLTPTQWKEITTSPELLSKFHISASSLEGYLYPETYWIQKQTSPEELVTQMVTLFFKKITPNLMEETKQIGFTLHQWVTLASIIEKETGLASERPMIASVFLNRLKIGMRLQTDPTVIYGIENFNGNITRADLERDTPYNTYTREGLPPGPICSPGFESLKAVLLSAKTNYLYFVAKGDGSHQFSATLEEHNRAVDQYQRQ